MKKPEDLLEYVVVYEMVHLRAPKCSNLFVEILSVHYPGLLEAHKKLDNLPLPAEARK